MKSYERDRFPDWTSLEEMIKGIWERKYYTNHGPLVVELEAKLEKYIGVKNVICVTNNSIALMISILATGVKGKAIVPAFSHINVAQSVLWAGLNYIFCDSKEDHPAIDTARVKNLLCKETELIIAINPLGHASDIEELEWISKVNGLKLIFISDSVFGQKFKGKTFGGFGDIEIFSFRESQLANGGDGACVCTNDDLLAARLRNIRSSYGAGKPVSIPFTGNGRMSEVQAGLVLLSLHEMEKNKKMNRMQFDKISKLLYGDMVTINPSHVTDLNYSMIFINITDKKNNPLKNIIAKLNAHGISTKNFRKYGIDPLTKKELTNFKNLKYFKDNSVYYSNNF